jgi:predicted TIM-barrel fold metal-dependent hydrolase
MLINMKKSKKINQSSRRDFLKNTSLAAAGFFIVPRHVLGRGYVAPSDKLNIAGIGAGGSGCFISKKMEASWKLRYYLKSFGTTREELEQKGDAYVIQLISEKLARSQHVGQAIVLALDGVVDERGELDRARTEIYLPNEFVARETAKTTNLLFGASINPHRGDALVRLDWAKANGAQLIKWIPSIMAIDPADERLVPFYKKLIELKLPLLTHAGQERSFTHANDALCDPERLRLPLRLGVTVIVAHIASTGENAGERDTDRLRPLFAEYPNLYSEISSLTQANKLGYLREALTHPEFEGRLLYGTDFPLINMPLVSPYFFPLNLTRRQMVQIHRIENPWDRDVALKQALGVPRDLFARSRQIFRSVDGRTN